MVEQKKEISRLADHQDEIADGVAEVTQAFIHPSIHCLLV
jgi:hypothetical protein